MSIYPPSGKCLRRATPPSAEAATAARSGAPRSSDCLREGSRRAPSPAAESSCSPGDAVVMPPLTVATAAATARRLVPRPSCSAYAPLIRPVMYTWPRSPSQCKCSKASGDKSSTASAPIRCATVAPIRSSEHLRSAPRAVIYGKGNGLAYTQIRPGPTSRADPMVVPPDGDDAPLADAATRPGARLCAASGAQSARPPFRSVDCCATARNSLDRSVDNGSPSTVPSLSGVGPGKLRFAPSTRC